MAPPYNYYKMEALLVPKFTECVPLVNQLFSISYFAGTVLLSKKGRRASAIICFGVPRPLMITILIYHRRQNRCPYQTISWIGILARKIHCSHSVPMGSTTAEFTMIRNLRFMSCTCSKFLLEILGISEDLYDLVIKLG